MAEIKKYNALTFSEKQIKEIYTGEPKITYKKIFDNKKLVDTAGFVPLDVRIKQFLLSGEQYKMSAEMFDSDDWRYMYSNINDTQLEVGDDLEEVRDKLSLVIQRKNELLVQKGLIKPFESYEHDEGAGEEQSEKQGDDGSSKDSKKNEKSNE